MQKEALPHPEYSLKKRCLALFLIFAALGLVLLGTLFKMQIFDYATYQEKVLNQITVGAGLKAPRGQILAKNGEVLAESRTVWRVRISPVDIRAKSKESGKDCAALIAKGLAPLLGISEEDILEKTKKTSTLDQTLKRGCDEKTAKSVLSFVAENGLSNEVRVEAGVARYYPYGTLACHTIGFTGSDSQGLYGLEAFYEETLAGKDGKYVQAIDSTGKVLPDEYSGYIAAEEGNTLHTTIDIYIQEQLELQLEAAMENSGAENRVCGVVMNVNTGEVLAMATLPSYDCNAPYELNEASLKELLASGLAEGSAEYTAKKAELLYETWNNKTVSETYEPGSTFKILTAAMALEEGAVTPLSRFNCHGYYTVGGWNISCHKKTGHGSGITFAYGLQQSCNPVLMQSAERLGSSKFYSYFSKFGYLEKPPVDLPSVSAGIFHTEEGLGVTELATSSFGQRFKVTVIGHLAAIASVANGGTTVTPHIVERITDKDGKTLWEFQNSKGTRVISEETAKTVTAILEEGVSKDGGAKNAYVAGYKIAAKTGTSEKFDVLDSAGNSYLRVGSCVGYGPAESPEIAVIIIVDEPTGPSVYGSVVAAPYVSAFMANVLPYLGYEPHYTEEEEAMRGVAGDYVSLSPTDAKSAARQDGFAVELIGNGEKVLYQVPKAGSTLSKEGGKILLYTEDAVPQACTVPDVLGKTAAEANRLLLAAGFNVAFSGALNHTVANGARITAQSFPPGTEAVRGTIITVTVTWFDDTD